MASSPNNEQFGAWRSRWLQVREQFQHGIMRNATWMLSGRGMQLAGRFVYFIIIAHVLGPSGYGTFVACTALAATMSPFASCGTGDVMIKYAARDRQLFAAYLGNALLVTTGLGALLTLLALLIRPMVLPPSATVAMLVSVAMADLVGTEILGICLRAFQVLEQARLYAHLMGLSTGLRFVGALVLALVPATATRWAYLYAASSLIASLAGIVAVVRCSSMPRLRPDLLIPSLREGFHFSTSLATQYIYDGIDKTMLARLSTVEAAAIFAVACRFIEAAMLPIRAVAAATYPEFFRQGAGGVTSAFAFARRILRRSVLYGLASSLALFLAAGLVPYIMGRSYAESAVALRWLCVLPLIKCVHAFLTDTLTGSDYQWQRSSLQIGIAVFNVLINFWLIPAFHWRGAAWSSVLTNALLMVLLYVIIRWHLKRERTARPATIQPVFAGEGN